MLKSLFVFCFFVAVCHSETPVTEVPRVYCGESPNNLFTCLGSPQFFSRTSVAKCKSDSDECERITCLFRESGWLTDNKIDKQKMKDSFTQFASDQPVWVQPVTHLKAACLEHDLPAQGFNVNCPTYDVMHCVQNSFIKHSPSSQWSKEPDCAYALSYATHCPVCPNSCFATQIPIGSCNACVTLPRTP